MAYIKRELSALANFLPEGTYDWILPFFIQYPIELSLTKDRKTLYGTYSYDYKSKRHRITVNGNLHPYQFLLTLLHELAHLITFVQYGARVAPHGDEWKSVFRNILKDLLQLNLLPKDLSEALARYTYNMKSSQCYDPVLMQALRKYSQPDLITLSDLKIGAKFVTEEKRDAFEVVEKLRTRYKCRNIRTGHVYLFAGHCPVIPLTNNSSLS